MRAQTASGVLVLSIATMLGGCPLAEDTQSANAAATSGAHAFAGWYMQHAGQGSFQACGQPRPWRVSTAAELPTRAKAFGLDDDTPVYVRIQGTRSRDGIDVWKVEQFGSPTPVRDCPMTGVVIPSAPAN